MASAIQKHANETWLAMCADGGSEWSRDAHTLNWVES